MGGMTRRHLITWYRRILRHADRLHPAALCGLIAVLLLLGYGVGPVVAAALAAAATAAVALVKAAAALAAAGLLGRLAVRTAYCYFARPAAGTKGAST